MINDSFSNRQYIIRIFIAVLLAIFVIQLFNLQLIKDYGEQADSNALLRRTIYAPRGLIYDRNGVLLVYNQPTYDILITMHELRAMAKNNTPLDTLELCQTLSITKAEFDKRIKEVKNRIGYSPRVP